MGGLIKFLGRFRSASNRALALMASLLISVSELAALHVIYMYHGTGTCTISCTCMYFHALTAGTAACNFYMLSMVRVPLVPVPIMYLVPLCRVL